MSIARFSIVLSASAVQVREHEPELLEKGGIPVGISRPVSLLAALACLGIAYFSGGGATFHLAVIVVVLPLGCIWYGDEIGGFMEMSAQRGGGSGNAVGKLITVAGWVGLVSLFAIIVFFAFGRSQ